MQQPLVTRINAATAAIKREGGTIPAALTDAVEARGRLEDYRTRIDNAHEQRLAGLTDSLATAAASGSKPDTVVPQIEDALTLASRQQISDNGIWDKARRQLDAALAGALGDAGEELHAASATIIDGLGQQLAPVAQRLKVADLMDAAAVVKQGGTAAADAAVALDIVGRIDALVAALVGVLGGTWKHDGLAAKPAAVVRICEPVNLEHLQDLTAARSTIWAAARTGAPIRLATATDFAEAGDRITEEHKANTPYTPRFDVMA